MMEYLRPWKLITLALGLNALIVGAKMEQLPDRAVCVSVIMALLTYFTAPWGVRVCIERRWRWVPLALFYAWLTIDGSYFAWNAHRAGGEFAEFVGFWREANLWPSTLLYFLCGFIWIYRGSLAQARTSISALGPRGKAMKMRARVYLSFPGCAARRRLHRCITAARVAKWRSRLTSARRC